MDARATALNRTGGVMLDFTSSTVDRAIKDVPFRNLAESKWRHVDWIAVKDDCARRKYKGDIVRFI